MFSQGDYRCSRFFVLALQPGGQSEQVRRKDGLRQRAVLTFSELRQPHFKFKRYQNSSSSVLASSGTALEYVPLAPI